MICTDIAFDTLDLKRISDCDSSFVYVVRHASSVFTGDDVSGVSEASP